jgi:hypothetical protein
MNSKQSSKELPNSLEANAPNGLELLFRKDAALESADKAPRPTNPVLTDEPGAAR